MKGSYRITCQSCQAESSFVVEPVSATDLEVTIGVHGCFCPDRPTAKDAVEMAAEDFMNRIEGARWAALGGRV